MCIAFVFLLSVNSIQSADTNITNDGLSVDGEQHNASASAVVKDVKKTTPAKTKTSNVKTFSDLMKEIKKAKPNSVFILNGEYKYNPKTDGKYKNGIVISKNIKIIGINGATINGNGKMRCLILTSGIKVSISKVTFKNGLSNNENGGGIFVNRNSQLILKHCTFKNNKAYKANGGAICTAMNCKLEIHNCDFYKNKAIRASDKKWPKDQRGMGGAIHVTIGSSLKVYNSVFKKNSGYLSIILVLSQRDKEIKYSNALIKNCLFEKNTANINGVFYLDEYGSGRFIESTFKKNVAKDKGGTLVLDASKKALVKKCHFEDNVGEYGGAVDLFKFKKKISHVSIVNCVFKENTARECGGAIFSDYGYLTIKNCKFYQNKASKSGGALEVRSGKLRLMKPVFNSNSAKYGGALLIKNKKSIYSKNTKYIHNKASHGKNILAIYANSVSKLKIIH